MAGVPPPEYTNMSAPAQQMAAQRPKAVSRLTSLPAKLFYYMTALVLITIAGNSFQYIRTFMSFQTQQVQDQVQLQAERASGQIESAIDAWRAQVAVALPTLKTEEGEVNPALLRKFVDSSSEFVGFQMLGAASATSTTFKPLGESLSSASSDPRFEDKVPAKVWVELKGAAKRWLKRDAPRNKKQNVLVESFAKTTGLPILMVAVRFDVANSKEVVWAVLATWQTNVIKALPKSKFIDSVVVDGRGKTFSSPSATDMVRRKKFSGAKLLKSALTGSAPAGFEPEYQGEGGKKRLGAFSRLPKYGISVLVEMDAEMAFQALKKNLSTTALWAVLFILFAVGFAYIGANGITRGLREVTQATERIAAGDFRHQIRPTSRDEIAVLGHAVNNMSSKIVGLMRNQVEKARIEQELETAKMVQGTFFPRDDIRRGSVFVTGYYQPATECGGDLWGHFSIREGVDFVFVADATGHGAPAALVTAICYSTTQTIADLLRDNVAIDESPSRILERLNRIIYEAVRGKICMTFYAAVIDTVEGRIITANAGHNFPLLIPSAADDDRQGKVGRARAKRAGGRIQPISLKIAGTPLGMDPKATYRDETLELRAGDKLFMFTDGLIECSNPQGAVWGRKFLVDQLVDTCHLGAESMREEIVSRAFRFFANKPLMDDVTVAVIEIDKSWKKSAKPSQAKTTVITPAVATLPAAAPLPAPAPASATLPPAVTVTARPAAPQPQASVHTADSGQHESRPVSPTSSPAPTPLGRGGKYKIKLPSTG